MGEFGPKSEILRVLSIPLNIIILQLAFWYKELWIQNFSYWHTITSGLSTRGGLLLCHRRRYRQIQNCRREEGSEGFPICNYLCSGSVQIFRMSLLKPIKLVGWAWLLEGSSKAPDYFHLQPSWKHVFKISMHYTVELHSVTNKPSFCQVTFFP